MANLGNKKDGALRTFAGPGTNKDSESLDPMLRVEPAFRAALTRRLIETRRLRPYSTPCHGRGASY